MPPGHDRLLSPGDSRQAKFVGAEILENGKPASQVAVQFAFDSAGRLQERSQLRKQFLTFAAPRVDPAVHVFQQGSKPVMA